MTDLTRLLDGFQKKTKCMMTMLIAEGTDTDQGEIAAADANHLLGLLPPDSLITEAYIQVEVVGDAVTSTTMKLGTASGGAQILSAADGQSLGKEGTFVTGVETGTGAEVWFNIAHVGGSQTAVGKYRVFVEYIEFTKNTGEYTKFN